MAAMYSCARTDINEIVGSEDRILIVLNDDNSVPNVAQITKCFNETIIVLLVESDGWFVQHIERPDKP